VNVPGVVRLLVIPVFVVPVDVVVSLRVRVDACAEPIPIETKPATASAPADNLLRFEQARPARTFVNLL
jgi:hypothetical protein